MKTHLLHIILLALILGLFCSCKSSSKSGKTGDKKEQTTISVKKENKELSEKFGFKVTKDDNLALYKELSEWLGVKYKYGGNDKKGVDCSGLVCQVYLKVYDKKLYRRSSDIYDKNCRKVSKSKLKEGDLVFFATGKKRGKVSHVGIYLKGNKFVHASSSKGVMVSDMESSYWVRTFVDGGKVN